MFVALAGCGSASIKRAFDQRVAVAAIEATRGIVVFDWQTHDDRAVEICPICTKAGPHGPAWLRKLLGDDFFQEVRLIGFDPKRADVKKLIPHLRRMRGLRCVQLRDASSSWPQRRQPVYDEAREQLAAALPGCLIQMQ
ncbi:MAG TPA: hypothetical protein VHB99_11785 [Pirellulales bacterium]|nr:hypothetical protein [Pirellulales bacterium]